MKLSLNWLNDFVDIKDIKPTELAEKLTNAGFEVESIEYKSKGMERVFVGEIKKLERHPNADRLQVCTIDVGFEVVQILTAATNVFEGAQIPVALDGADLPCGVLIKTSKMRGLESQGMLCSGAELKIDNSVYDGAEIDGIMILHENYNLGTPIAEVLGLDDVVLDISVLSNRPDCNSVLGLAREISVLYDRELKLPSFDYKECDLECRNCIDVDINTDRCLRYMASVVTDLKICESPKFIKQRLNAVGIRSINNIVDITNYVLIEIGQPMHSFDYDKIYDKSIEIRNARNCEKTLALNMQEYTLDNKDTVIADRSRVLAIAGIMGGFNSGINSMSKSLVFESATFARGSIRSTSRKLGLSSDSSNRFEKGVEPALCELGLKRALNLVSSLGYGKICKGIVEECLIDIKPKILEFSIKDITRLLSIKIDNEKIKEILTKLDFKVEINGDVLKIEVPIVRSDIDNISDIAEEIIRIYGFDNVESRLLTNINYTPRISNIKLDNILKIKNQMVDLGFFEINTFTLSNLDFIKNLNLTNVNIDNIISLSNPLNEDLKYLRTTMADSMLKVVASNNRHGNKNLKLFEFGRVYIPNENDVLPTEVTTLCFAITGKNIDFFKAKSIVEQVSNTLDIVFNYKKSNISYLNNFKSAELMLNDKSLGSLGFVHPNVLKNYNIDEDVILCEINVEGIINNIKEIKTFKPFSKFPCVYRDFSFVVPNELNYIDVYTEIKNSSGKNCVDVELIDEYTGDKIQKGFRSLTFRLKYEKEDSTFTDDEIEKMANRLIKSMQYKLNINLREI